MAGWWWSVNGYDGPTLKALRENSGIPLRRVARQAGMSHGHLSKVEHGETGRPVTPAVLSAYEKATGVILNGVAGHGPADPSSGGGWRRGHLPEARRRTWNAKVAAVAVGGPLGEQVERIMDGTGRARPPEVVEEPDVAQLERVERLLTDLDLRLGGSVVDQMAKALLRWVVRLLDTPLAGQIETRLFAAVGALAQRTAWAAFDADSHEVARSLFKVGLYAATRADDPNLRAHLLADFAAQYNYLGYADEGLQVVRLAEVDERVDPAVLIVVNGVKARAYAVKGDADACRRHIQLAEQAQPQAPARAGERGWLDTVATHGQLNATTGHALATLARRTGSAEAGEEAQRHLRRAIETLDHTCQARTVGLCMAQLATIQLETCGSEVEPGLLSARLTLDTVAGVRSSRVGEHLVRLRTAAEAHQDDPAAKDLVTELDTLLARPAR